MKALVASIILVTASCSSSDNKGDEVIVAIETSEHNHTELEDAITSLNERVAALESKPDTIINFTGQEAEAIKELIKQSPYIDL